MISHLQLVQNAAACLLKILKNKITLSYFNFYALGHQSVFTDYF